MLTFAGDAVWEQLVPHKAGADNLLPRVPALLFAGPAAWKQSQREQRPGAPRDLLGIPLCLDGAEDVPSRGTDAERQALQAGAHHSLPSTPFPWETPKVWP